ncbi:MAG: FecR domain-containing protein [Candidatus Blackburnbacteria bacterium]|nr:FecR domain-containing protein [Candidatus Blackburnbacteria bacterium]
MKKFLLPAIVLLTLVFFLPQKADAQTKEECDKIRARASYNCLTEWSKCYYPCIDQTKDVKACGDTCTKAEDACDKQVEVDYKVCLSAKPKTSKGPSWLEFLGINPYQTWLRLREVAEVSEFFASGDLEDAVGESFLNLFNRKSIRQKDEEKVKAKEQTFEAVFGKDWREQLRQAKIDSKTEENAWEIPVPKQESVTNVPGTADTKRYSWDTNSGAVIKSNDWEKIEFKQPVKTAGGETIRTVKLDEGEMEVRVRNNNPSENQFGVDAGWLGVTVSRTHFRVLNDRINKLAVVGVYEGEVEVKTRDGQTIKVKPDEDKPGVVLVSKKLSPVKLAIAGFGLLTVTGGVVFLLKRKGNKIKKKLIR